MADTAADEPNVASRFEISTYAAGVVDTSNTDDAEDSR